MQNSGCGVGGWADSLDLAWLMGVLGELGDLSTFNRNTSTGDQEKFSGEV